MSITVELTYELGKLLGTRRFEVEGCATLADVLRLTRARFADHPEDVDRQLRMTALVVNGVLSNYRSNLATRLVDGDRVGFLKAAAGG